MMNFDTVSGAQKNPTPPATAGKPQSEKTGFSHSADFNMFLRMLTTQMQNQNPLNPVDSADFAVQLATFSGVEQQIRTNDLLNQLHQQLSLSDLSGWLGREVAIGGPIAIGHGSVGIETTAVAGADRRELVIRNDAEQEVARIPVAAQGSALTLPHLPHLGTGRYNISAESFRGTEKLGERAAYQFQEIREVQTGDNKVVFVLADNTHVAREDIAALREPRPQD